MGHTTETIFLLNLFFSIRLLAFHLAIYGKSNQNPPSLSLETTFPTQLKGSCICETEISARMEALVCILKDGIIVENSVRLKK